MNNLISTRGNFHQTMSSLQIAELTGKTHSNVMRDVRSILDQGVSQINFELAEYNEAQGKPRPCYNLTKKGCLILASGYDAKLREKIIDRWEELENERKNSDNMSSLQLFELTLNSIKENQIELKEIKKEVEQLKVKTATKPDYSTIVGYASLNGITLTYKQASAIGKKASKMCKRMGVMTDSTPDPRFGRVIMYPSHVLDEIFNSPIDDGCGF